MTGHAVEAARVKSASKSPDPGAYWWKMLFACYPNAPETHGQRHKPRQGGDARPLEQRVRGGEEVAVTVLRRHGSHARAGPRLEDFVTLVLFRNGNQEPDLELYSAGRRGAAGRGRWASGGARRPGDSLPEEGVHRARPSDRSDHGCRRAGGGEDEVRQDDRCRLMASIISKLRGSLDLGA